MKRLTVRHATTYRYAQPVSFGPHRMMLRPRDSHDLRLVRATLAVTPKPTVRWLHDVFGNSVAEATFDSESDTLEIVSTLELERYARGGERFPLDPLAETYPFVYAANDRTDLGRLVESHHNDIAGEVDAWARSFVTERNCDTLDLLSRMNRAIKADFAYAAREAEGTQEPNVTLAQHSGTCRDFALLFIEAARHLGFGARFVTGYLYDPALDGGAGGVQGAGATHAWADVYLPGSGWVEYDPTNGLIGAENLIRVAVTREPSQAAPITGAFEGPSGAFQGMSVDVTVTAS